MKKIKIVAIILILVTLFFPIAYKLKDGGTREYKALLYSITKLNALDNIYPDGFRNGTIIKILGFEIYNNVE